MKTIKFNRGLHIARLDRLRENDGSIMSSPTVIGEEFMRLTENTSNDFMSWFLSHAFEAFEQHTESFVQSERFPTPEIAPLTRNGRMEFPIIQDDGLVNRVYVSFSEIGRRDLLLAARSPMLRPFEPPVQVIEHSFGVIGQASHPVM